MARRDDLAFANDLRAALDQRSPRGAWFLLTVILLMMCGAVAWASWAQLEEVTTGEGRVVPSSQTQVVQTLEGGIVRAILVREGDVVNEGQVLIRIDDTGFASRLGELNRKRWALEAETIRLRAEADGVERADAIAFPERLQARDPELLASQRRLFSARRSRLSGEADVLRQQLIQREQSARELSANRAKLQATLSPLRKELRLVRRLRQRGAVPEIDLLRLQREAATLEGELKVVSSSIPRANAAIAEAKKKIENVFDAFRTAAREELAKQTNELSIVLETLKAASDRVRRTALVSPTRGVVNKIHMTTLGSVVQPGRDVIEIVPIDDTLEIEARIKPRDVAFISPEQKASVKLTAYDFLIYGALEGRVTRIGADTTVDQNGEAFYRVTVKTAQSFLQSGSRQLPILPGMVATVDIQTGSKTVLDYVLKPVLRAQKEAMRER